MWLIDINDRAYSKDANGYRQFFVVRKELQYPFEVWDEIRERWKWVPVRKRMKFFVGEHWRTPESEGDTGDFDHYEFATYQEACIFIADLIVKLNSPCHNALIQAAKEITDEIIKCSPDKLQRLVDELYAHESARRKQQRAESERRQKQERERQQRIEVERRQQRRQQIRQLQQQQLQESKSAHHLQQQAQRELQRIKAKQATHDPNKKAVYIFDMGNGTVKIGVSVNVEQRATTIENSSGLTITRRCHTEQMPTRLSLQIEENCHTHFAEHRTKGEFFKITYEDACAYLLTITPVTKVDGG